MTTDPDKTASALTLELLTALRGLRDAAVTLHNETRLADADKVYVAARLLIDVQAFTVKLNDLAREVRR